VTVVKVCGLTHPDDVAAAVTAGADRLGFVIEYPTPVPWNLDTAEATRLMAGAAARVRVAVVSGERDHLIRIARETGPDMIQLHADETPDVVEAVARTGVPVLKALRADVGRPAGPPEEWIALARTFVDAGAAEILLDSRSADRPAGTGVTFNWEIARAVVDALDVPVVLAGGLTPHNVADAVGQVGPAGVDVISGVETAGHRKDSELMRRFVRAASARR